MPSIAPDLKGILGAQSLFDWFGYWPSFRNAELLGLELNRLEVSILRVHTWEIIDGYPKGPAVHDKDVVVEFRMYDISDVQLSGFSQENCVGGLLVVRVDDTYEIRLGPAYGLTGVIVAGDLEIHIDPSMPAARAA